MPQGRLAPRNASFRHLRARRLEPSQLAEAIAKEPAVVLTRDPKEHHGVASAAPSGTGAPRLTLGGRAGPAWPRTALSVPEAGRVGRRAEADDALSPAVDLRGAPQGREAAQARPPAG